MGWLLSSKIKWVIFFGIVIGLTVAVLFGDYSNPRREIFFRYNSKVSIAFLFGYLPNDYFNNYTENIIEETDAFRITSIIYNKFPTENHNYILFQESGEKKSEKILLDSDSLFWKYDGTANLLSSQIELSAFNKYLNLQGVNKKNELINQFCRLMSDFGLTNYKIATCSTEISELRKVNVFDNNYEEECYKMLQDNFFPDFETFTYLWLNDIGLFEMSFVVANGQLISINDRFIFGPLALSIGTEKCQ